MKLLQLLPALYIRAVFIGLLASASSGVMGYADDWIEADGGIFNPPSEIFNPDHAGYDSTGRNTIYNKIDLRNGETIYIADGAPMYDFNSNLIGQAKGSGVGYYGGTRDGGLVAGSLSKIKVGGVKVWVTYAWSLNVEGGGRQSGWVEVSQLSPYNQIFQLLKDTEKNRMKIFQDEIDDGDYKGFKIIDAKLPNWMEEDYLVPNRDAARNQGKAKYYYTRDGLISGLMNIPETGSQRYGVANNIMPIGDTFYRDMNVARVNVSIYKAEQSSARSHSLRLVWGYVSAKGGKKVYSWINERALDN